MRRPAAEAANRPPAEAEPGPLAVGPVLAEPGERAEGRLPVLSLADGTEISLPVCLINGARPGRTLYLQAVSDGDELNGLGVIREILRELRPEDLSGRVIAVPVVNWSGFQAHQHTNPLDGKKLNRCFPGKRHGSASERIAYTLLHRAVLQADLVLDLHQGSVRPMIDEVRVRVGATHRLHPQCLELARIFGVGYLLDERGPRGQLARVAPDRGIPAIDPELGGCHGWDVGSIAKGVRGVRNVLRHYGFLPGEPELPEAQWLVRRLETVRARHGGLVDYRMSLYDRVEAGDLLAEVTDLFGNRRELIKAPVSGIFWSRAVYPTAAGGAGIAWIDVNPERLG